MIVSLDAARATNLHGQLTGDCRHRLAAVIDTPTESTWDAAHGLIVNAARCLTLWQAVLAVDPTFPRVGPRTTISGEKVAGWARVPDRETLCRALAYAVTAR